jgi:hypothetical protein
MLDGHRYFAEFPDEAPQQPRRRLTDDVLAALAAIEREISAFIDEASERDAASVGSNRGKIESS